MANTVCEAFAALYDTMVGDMRGEGEVMGTNLDEVGREVVNPGDMTVISTIITHRYTAHASDCVLVASRSRGSDESLAVESHGPAKDREEQGGRFPGLHPEPLE